jgi:glycosyltransferase involved in cell wall biosynthesis
MTDTLTLQAPPTLPLPFDEGSVQQLDLRGILGTLAPPDQLFLLLEARRVLRPGGVLRLASGTAALDAMARQVGLASLGGALRESGDSPGPSVDAFSKPDRRVTGTPLVSLLIPAYSPAFFEASLASAIAQTYANLEIIVCDDSAGEDIERIARRLAHGRQVTYVRNPVRLKGRWNYAKCFGLASGEFIKYLNDDDVLRPDCVERLLDAFRRAPATSLATSYRQRIDPAGRRLGDQRPTRPLVEKDTIISGPSMANAMLMAGLNVIGEPSTTLFRKADLQAAIPGEFRFESEDSFGIIDIAMWVPLLLKGDMAYIREGLSQFRQHDSQQQRHAAVVARRGASIRRLQQKWISLGLHARLSRETLMVKPLDSPAEPWRALPFAPLQPSASLPQELWRYSAQVGGGSPPQA